MEEFGPIVGGALLGCMSAWLPNRPWRHVVALVCGAAFAIAWSGAVGELSRFSGYALVDAAQVCIAFRRLISDTRLL